MKAVDRINVRPAQCGACYAKLYSKDFREQYLTATDFAPRLRHLANGFLIAQERAGLNGIPFSLYKVRTMRDDITPLDPAYREKLTGSNPKVTPLGKILRRYWIDEIPQLLNLTKGDVKLIGLRALPLAITYVLPEEYRQQRQEIKPGLISVAYVYPQRKLIDQIQVEKDYLAKYLNAPFKTDLIYFAKFLQQIIFKGIRSK